MNAARPPGGSAPAVPGASAFGSVLTQPRPVTNGAGLLRFGSLGAMARVDGGKPTSRGLPPAALGTGAAGKQRLPSPKKGFSRVWTLERVRAEPAVLPAGWLRGRDGLMERRTACFRSPPARLLDRS